MTYGGHAALADVDIDVASGEVVGVLGPNGAGKTTLLRLLSSARKPSAGTVSLPGRREIGVAGDDAVHLDALTGRENALLFARLAGLLEADAEKRIAALLERFDLGADADRPVAHYSFGMRRKLLLLEALAHQPRLIILDEPTTGLDRQGRDALHDLLRERAAGGAAIVLASNDPVEPRRLCDRVVFLHHGRVVLDGAPAELIERLGGESRVEVKTPDLSDVFLAATGEELRPDPRPPTPDTRS